jgi:hypothetical protein
MAIFSIFYTGAATFLQNYTYEAECTQFQTYHSSENLEVPGIEPATSGYVARNSDH